MINIFLFVSSIFLLTLLLGKLIEKIRVPWIFASLILGALLAFKNPFVSITSSQVFTFLANFGMYSLLFVVGMELDVNDLKKQGRFIINTTLITITLATIFGLAVIKIFFNYNWFISTLIALSFATVGEAILIPILDEFKIINTKLGQSIIGVGTLDDLFELLTLILVVIIVGSKIHTNTHIILTLGWLGVLFLLTIGMKKFSKEGEKFNFLSIETAFLFTLFILFLFLGVGKFADSTPLAALLAGISLKTFLPKKRLKLIEEEIKTLCYGFFAPIFFFWVGITMNMSYLLTNVGLLLLVFFVSLLAKLLGSYIIAGKKFGFKESTLLGIGLSARFSTSIVIIKILLEQHIIGTELYSIIIGSTILFTFLIPIVFSNLIVKWGVNAKSKISE